MPTAAKTEAKTEAKWDGVITNGGNDLLNSWVTGKVLTFDHAAAGTGYVADIPLMAQTALVNQKQIVSIVGAEKVPEGCRLKLQVTPIDTGYKLNQFGVWASVTGSAVTMIAIFQHKDGIPIPSKSETPDFAFTFYATVMCSNKGEWTVNLDASALVTHGDMEAAIGEAVAKKQDMTLIGQGEPTAATEGVVGQHYLDIDTATEYLCLGHDEAEGYIWVAPFLLGSGGKVNGTFEVMDYFKVGDGRVYITRRLMAEEADFASEVNVGGSLVVEKTGEIKSSLTIGQVDAATGYRRGNLYVFGSSELKDDVTIGRVDEDGSHKGSLTVLGQIIARAAKFEGTLTTQNIYPDVENERSIGKSGTRFNTAYVKKVDASEHVSTPKVRPPQGTKYIKFMCAGNDDPEESPNPLPSKWGGTGKTDAPLYPQIVVTVAAGSSVTCTNGDKSFTATASDGTATFEVAAYGAWTVTATLSGQASNSEIVQVDAVKKYPITLGYTGNKVFGVCWTPTNPSTALARVTTANDPFGYVTVNVTTEPQPAIGTGAGSSPFDSYAPWKDMDEYNIIGGAVGPRKGESGFSRFNDTVVYIPEFYFKIVESGGKRYFYVSDTAKTGFTKHPGSGKYLSRYHADASYMSRTGTAPLVEIDRPTARTGAKGKGAKWSLHDYATWCAVGLLYLVEFADWDSQAKIGRDYVDFTWQDGKTNNGGTDAMAYHTGRAAGVDGKTSAQYRHLENLWGNVCEWIDGINVNIFDVYACTDHTKYADDTATNYVKIATHNLDDECGYTSALASPPANAPWAYVPIGISGSATTYIPDYCGWWGSSETWYLPYVGGGWYYGSRAGLFRFYADCLSDEYSSDIGARLLFNP